MGAHLVGDPEPQKPTTMPVTLHVYDAFTRPDFVVCNRALLQLFGTGAFHCGVQVYGREWSYGSTRSGTGVFCHEPMSPPGAPPCESISMGTVELSTARFHHIIENLAMEWVGSEYDLLAQNCCHFCKELLKRLGVVTPFPTWVSQLAEAGHNLRKEGCGAAQALSDLDRCLVQQMEMAGHCLGRECGSFGTALQCNGGRSCNYCCCGGRQGDEKPAASLLQDSVLPQGPIEDEAFACSRGDPPKWNPTCMLCESENGLSDLSDLSFVYGSQSTISAVTS